MAESYASVKRRRSTRDEIIERRMRWHFLVSPGESGAHNMALDDALMRRADRTGDAVFRVYGWSAPTLSLGRNQRARGLYDAHAARARGVGIVRRPTGGRALLHHREITYSATLPVASGADARAAYEFINDVLLGALEWLGVSAARATGAAAVPPGPRPCFDVPSEHEIVVGARKLVGSAQWRRGGALLQHGSILVRDDQGMIADLMTEPSSAPPPAAACLADALGREPGVAEVAPLLRDALGARVGRPPIDFEPDDVLCADVDRLIHDYRDEGWTWRR